VGADAFLSPAAEDRDIWDRVLVPFGQDLGARAHELSVMLADRARIALSEIYTDPEAVEANRASTEESVRALADAIVSGADPRPVELPAPTIAYAQASARQGIPAGPLLRNYRVAHAAMWEWAVGELAQRAEGVEEYQRAIAICSEWMFAYIDAALIVAEEVYSHERERFARSAAAVRSQQIEAILDQREGDPHAAGSRLRYALDREHIGVCAWLDRAPAAGDSLAVLESVVFEMAHALGVDGALLHPLGLLDAAGWVSSDAGLDPSSLDGLRLDTERFGGARIAVGEPAHGIAGFRSSHLESLQARRVATLSERPSGSVTRYGLVALQALAASDIDQARAFVGRELGALTADDDTSRRLAATLRVYLDEHASRSRAAKRLGIHENTISYRIRQAEEILGRSVDEETLDLRVALALAAMTRLSGPDKQ
jgi:hypothetical protein